MTETELLSVNINIAVSLVSADMKYKYRLTLIGKQAIIDTFGAENWNRDYTIPELYQLLERFRLYYLFPEFLSFVPLPRKPKERLELFQSFLSDIESTDDKQVTIMLI